MKFPALCTRVTVAMLFLTAAAVAQESREVTKSVPLKAGGAVSIDTYKGSITVNTWDKPQVDIHAVIEADDNVSSKYSEEKVRDTDIRIDATENRVTIKTDYDNIRDHRRGFFSWLDGDGSLPLVHYTISMPATATLKINDYKSRSTVTNLHAALDLNTYKGDVEVVGHEGPLSLETYKGEVRAECASLKERSRVETYKGRVTLTVPKKSAFDLDADLGYRTSFSTDFDIAMEHHGRHHSNAEYHGPVNGGGPSLAFRSTKGSIRLRGR